MVAPGEGGARGIDRRGPTDGAARSAASPWAPCSGAWAPSASPDQYGVTAGIVAALCAFLLVAAVVVFVAVPGPGTAGTLARSAPAAGSATVVSVLLLLSTTAAQRWIWSLVAGAAAGWTAYAAWETRRTGN